MKKLLFLSITALVLLPGCTTGDPPNRAAVKTSSSSDGKAMVTFIELGSVNCIPCKAMQPIMRELEKKFGNQIRIEFYDVLEDAAPAQKYGIRVMPTQVFLDRDGREFHRHEGFYPLEQIESLLRARGLN